MAVSANYIPLSFGTETDTSIIGPARASGIVGIKPTVGLTSRSGVIPTSASMDTVGSFGRTVADAVHGLDAIVGVDDQDRATLAIERPQEQRYYRFLNTKSALDGAVFGLPHKRFWDVADPHYKGVVSHVFDLLRQAGATIIKTDFPSAEERFDERGDWDW